MNTLFSKYKWLRYAIGAFIVALGVAIIILALTATSKVDKIVNIVLASAFILVGSIFLFSNLIGDTHKVFTLPAVIGIGGISLGVALLVLRYHLSSAPPVEFIVYLLAIIMLAVGTFALFKGITFIVYKEKVILIVLMFILTAVTVTLGILAIVNAGKLIEAAYIVLGVILVVFGVLMIAYAATHKDA